MADKEKRLGLEIFKLKKELKSHGSSVQAPGTDRSFAGIKAVKMGEKEKLLEKRLKSGSTRDLVRQKDDPLLKQKKKKPTVKKAEDSKQSQIL
jgi:hypothetical protein